MLKCWEIAREALMPQLPNFVIVLDQFILDTIFLPLAKAWQRLTHTPPARLAWLLFAVIALVAMLDAWWSISAPGSTPLHQFSVALTLVWFLSGLVFFLKISAQMADGFRPRHPMYFLIMTIIRLALAFTLLELFFGFALRPAYGFPWSIAIKIGCGWAGFYLMNIFLPPEPLASEVQYGIRIK
jgi:hypothetical protein